MTIVPMAQAAGADLLLSRLAGLFYKREEGGKKTQKMRRIFNVSLRNATLFK
jgi:hypothetical protein